MMKYKWLFEADLLDRQSGRDCQLVLRAARKNIDRFCPGWIERQAGILELGHRRVLAVHVVADLSSSHQLPDSSARLGHRVRPKINQPGASARRRKLPRPYTVAILCATFRPTPQGRGGLAEPDQAPSMT